MNRTLSGVLPKICLGVVAAAMTFPTGVFSADDACLGGTVNTVLDGQRLITEGQQIVLTGIKTPEHWPDHPQFKNWPHGRQATKQLRSLVQGHRISLKCVGKADRYGRLHGYLFTGDQLSDVRASVQYVLVQAGAAMVWPTQQEDSNYTVLLDAENTAKMAGKGIWADSAYDIRPATASLPRNFFLTVTGPVQSAEVRKSELRVNFGKDWRTDFTAYIHIRKSSLDPALIQTGTCLTLRGWIYGRSGPAMDINHPGQIISLDNDCTIHHGTVPTE